MLPKKNDRVAVINKKQYLNKTHKTKIFKKSETVEIDNEPIQEKQLHWKWQKTLTD